MKIFYTRIFITGLFFLLAIFVANAEKIIVHNQAELNAAIKKAVPGDAIVLAKGEWKNTNIIFEANGTAQKPIIISVEEKGATQLTGNSFLKFGGNYLIADGLFFTNGYAETGAIVEFRKNDKTLANNCRLTNCVFENYSKPERFSTDSWLILWGKNNRIDHCTIGDKLNSGTTLIVNLDDERSQQNSHLIDSNYFHLHSPLGSNGGETIRVGVSRYSLTSSNTIIVDNYFEKCSGEVEIISVKSSDNRILRNTFFECEGGLVLRHGARNLVDGNLFICNNKPYTGGIRVINPGHTVTNNLVLNSAGVRFRAAFGVLNGVPNSQLSRYFQVKDANINHNSFINCASIIFGAGKDNERTLSPQNVTFANNFISTKQNVLYEDANKDGGVIFKNNFESSPLKMLPKGFRPVLTEMIEWHGLKFEYPLGSNQSRQWNLNRTIGWGPELTGADLSKVGFVDRNAVGAHWYHPSSAAERDGKEIQVFLKDSKSLPSIVANAQTNDLIRLMDEGRYEIEAQILVNKHISIIANKKVELVNVGEKSLNSFISIENGGSLYIKGIALNSAYKSFGDVQNGIISSAKNMVEHYTLVEEDCEFYSFNENNYACFKANKSTFADSIVFNRCIFRNMSGNAIDLSTEREDKGIYNAEKIVIRNCVFANMLSGAINIYRGGNDESTTGPSVTIDHCTFNDVDNREQGCVVKLLGVQYARITNCLFNNCGQGGRSIWFEELAWDDVKVDYCNFYNAGKVESFYGKLLGKNIFRMKPVFKNEIKFDFTQTSSMLNTKTNDAKRMGINMN